MSESSLDIRSYRVCFDLDRRVYRLERWRVPVPWGLPIRSLAYAAAALLLILLARQLPGLGSLIGALPTPVTFALAPIGIAYGLTRITVDGRNAHAAAGAWAKHLIQPRRLAGFAPAPTPDSLALFGDVCLAPDESAPTLRRARLEGPCRVLLRYPGEGEARGRRITITQTSQQPLWRGKTLSLERGQRLETRP